VTDVLFENATYHWGALSAAYHYHGLRGFLLPINNRDDVSASLFERELGVGDVGLGFGPELEPQYQLQHLQRVRMRVRLWWSFNAVANLGISLGLVLPLLGRPGLAMSATGLWANFLVSLPCAITLMWLAWSRRYLTLYLPLARVMVPISCAVSALFAVRSMAQGRLDELATVDISLMAPYFFAGLLYRSALCASLMTTAAFIVGAVALGFPPPVLLKDSLILVITSILCAIVCRDAEKISRRSFLETAMLADFGARDALSGLMNRRAFDEHLLRVWKQALRDGRSLAVLMIDIDLFKSYNDTYGHQAGDAMIRCVAQVLKGFARRPLDIAARYGGEEFALILYDLPHPDVADVAERARDAVEKAVDAGPEGNVSRNQTISVGVAMVMPMIDRTPDGAVQLADEALYEAKRTGRNRVVMKGVEDYRRLTTGSFRTVARTVL
jgi:diguanylate cyclase (GGDEF)-like protein